VPGWPSSENLGVGELDACGGEVELPFHPTILVVLAIDNPPRENTAMVHHKKAGKWKAKTFGSLPSPLLGVKRCAESIYLKPTANCGPWGSRQ
jgi:hypothetical protein